LRKILFTTLAVSLLVSGAVMIACGPGADAQSTGGRHAGAQDPGAEPPTRDRPERWVDPLIGETIHFTDAQWRTRLTPLEFDVLREQGTERAFTGVYADNHRHGVYRCAGCGAPLFSSDHKFESGTGWPSFTRAIAAGRVATTQDSTLGMVRTEVHCARCGGHLGHISPDGPPPTGQRYCIDSASLDFDAR